MSEIKEIMLKIMTEEESEDGECECEDCTKCCKGCGCGGKMNSSMKKEMKTETEDE